MSDGAGVPKSVFEEAYSDDGAGTPPWDIGRPQGDVVRLAESGGFKGNVLDLGCGTGENALYLAGKGLTVLGIDAVPAAIDKAKAKAKDRGVKKVDFKVADGLDLKKLNKTFDVILDCGFFHTLSDADRPKYLKSVTAATKSKGVLHILCFSDMEPGTDGPRRIGERELIELINNHGWLVDGVAEARFETNIHPDGARAWLMTFNRYGS